jgi:hypothetical protein
MTFNEDLLTESLEVDIFAGVAQSKHIPLRLRPAFKLCGASFRSHWPDSVVIVSRLILRRSPRATN